MDRINEEMELDLREIFQIIRKRLALIIVITLLFSLVSGIVSFFVMTPIYEASTDILVNKSEKGDAAIYNINDINTDLKLISTYSAIIKSPRILELVTDKYNLNMSAEQLADKLNINTVRDSQVMKISVQDPSYDEAVKIANGVAATFQQEIVKIMNVDNVQILTEAKYKENAAPIKPRKTLNVAIAFVLGFMVSVGLAFLLEYLDSTVKSEEEVERLLGYPVLGSISTIDNQDSHLKRRTSKKKQSFKRGETYHG